MKKEHIPYYISALSLVISGIAIGVSFYRTEELDMDYMGVIVGILSLLVTALLGWNIYSVINTKEEIKQIDWKINKKATIIEDKLKKEITDNSNETRKSVMENFILDEITLAKCYSQTNDWYKVIALMKNILLRKKDISELENKSLDVSGIVNITGQILSKQKDFNADAKNELVGYMELFKELWKYSPKVTVIYEKYQKENCNKPNKI